MYKLELKNVSYLYSKNTPFEKLALSDINIGFEAYFALLILEGRIVLAFVDSGNEGQQLLGIFDTTSIYCHYREQ